MQIYKSENLISEKPKNSEVIDAGKSEKETRERIRRYESPSHIKSPDEDVLISHKEREIKKIGIGITHPSFVELKDDGNGVFKTEEWERERAAYLIDRFLGLDIVPPTIVKQIGDKIGSLQRFIPDTKMAYEFENLIKVFKDIRINMIKMWLLDVIIDNRDRHGGNFLIKDSKVFAIDNGYSLNFSPGEYHGFEEEINPHCGYTDFIGIDLPDEIVAQMERFLMDISSQKILQDLLVELIGEDNAIACVKRINCLAKIIAENGMIPNGPRIKIT